MITHLMIVDQLEPLKILFNDKNCFFALLKNHIYGRYDFLHVSH